MRDVNPPATSSSWTKGTSHRRLRLYHRLRSVHLERAHAQTPAAMVYLDRSYDFDESLLHGLDVVRATALTAPLMLLRSRVQVLEVSEPLYRQDLLRVLLTVHAAQLSARIRRAPFSVVTYAIENRNPFSDPAHRLRSRARRWLEDRLSRRLALQIDRIAFGTADSERLYDELRGRELRGAVRATFPALADPCACPADSSGRPPSVAFVGAFDERKGVRELLDAWTGVQELVPDAELHLLGKGPLSDEVVARATGLTGVDVAVDPPRDEVHATLRNARVLVLLSQPRSRWREQVGLPILEGLSHGCTIVTTEQTGLATWLRAHGHTVVDSAAPPADVAQAIGEALRANRSPESVMADLPAVDGRALADRWMFDVTDSSKPGRRS